MWQLLDLKESSAHSIIELAAGTRRCTGIPPSQSTQAAAKVLGRYRGTVVAAGYAVYQKLSR